ncbi:MAG TPA: DNA-processing protein DprA [Solirubrobacteraceae bacterium]
MRTGVRNDLKDPQEYLLALCAIQGITSHTIARQAQRPGGLDSLVRGELDGNSRYNIDMKRALRIALQAGLEPELAKAREEIAIAREAGAVLVTVLDKEYPANLRLIYNLPPFLFVRGTLTSNDTLSVAVIGARDASAEVLGEARRISGELAKEGITVVSGLSAGTDTAAHEATLEQAGRTIAVLGSGILQCYPPENLALAERITGTGALVSRFWPTQTPSRYTFTNRCVVTSGIAQATLVVEADCPSIAQGQARQALEHGKHVFLLSRLVSAEPWAREYLKHGAIEVQSAEDVLRHIQTVEEIEALAATRKCKARVRVPYYRPEPISWGASSSTGSAESAWPSTDFSNQTPSSAWPSGSTCEDETKDLADGLAAGLQGFGIEGSMYESTEEEPDEDVARSVGTAFSFTTSLTSSEAREHTQEQEVEHTQGQDVELIFDPQLDGGYTVYAPELPGLVVKGETLEQATASATEALELYAKNMREHGKPIRHQVVRRKFPVPQ